MNPSVKYSGDLRNLLSPSAPKNEMFFRDPSTFALANLVKLASSSTPVLETQNLLESLSTLLYGWVHG